MAHVPSRRCLPHSKELSLPEEVLELVLFSAFPDLKGMLFAVEVPFITRPAADPNQAFHLHP